MLIVQGVVLWPTFSDSVRAIRELHIGWFAACIAAIALSMTGFGGVQRVLLHAGGVEVSQRRSEAVLYASTSMTLTLPAGQVFSAAFTYRQTRRWGATHVVATWQLAMAGVIATATLAIVGTIGAIAVGNSISPVTLSMSLLGMLVLVLVLRIAQRNPQRLESVGRWGVGLVNRARRRPPRQDIDRVRAVLDQIEAVRLRPGDAARTFWWSIVHRSTDVACLWFACLAVGADPRLAGVIIAFTASKAVASVPLAPGGIGTVDATLVVALTVSAGLPASQALAAVFVYRLVTLVLLNIAGWIVFLLVFRSGRAGDARAVAGGGHSSAQPGAVGASELPGTVARHPHDREGA
nr:YbhN family protein [Lolliginicoccus lacisalsi]